MSNNPSMVKYARGTIWMTRNHVSSCEKGVQSGTRPFLILSNNNRGPSLVVEGLWITSATKPFNRVNVSFTNDEERTSTVLCNQHATVNIDNFIEYMGTLSEDKMREVEEGMLFACGMGKYIEVEKNFNKLLATIDEAGREKVMSYLEGQQEEITRINLILCQLQSSLQKKLQSPGRIVTTTEIKTLETTPNEFKEKKHKILNEDNPDQVKKSRSRWTPEKMKEFVHDKESMTLSQVSEKYGVTKKSALTMYYKFKGDLAKE